MIDPRVQLIEVLWKDPAFRKAVVKIVRRLFPDAAWWQPAGPYEENAHIREEILRILGTLDLLPVIRKDAQ